MRDSSTKNSPLTEQELQQIGDLAIKLLVGEIPTPKGKKGSGQQEKHEKRITTMQQ